MRLKTKITLVSYGLVIALLLVALALLGLAAIRQL
jgi:hypothetical protein